MVHYCRDTVWNDTHSEINKGEQQDVYKMLSNICAKKMCLTAYWHIFGHKWKLLCEVKQLGSRVIWPWEKKVVDWSKESHHFHSRLKIKKLLLHVLFWVYQVSILSIENTKAPRVKFLEWVIGFFSFLANHTFIN